MSFQQTADAASPNATSAGTTRPGDMSYNPPDEAQSISLEGRRCGASDKLSEVPNDDRSTTTQLTWTPQDDESSGEVHEVAKSHEEAAGEDFEGTGGTAEEAHGNVQDEVNRSTTRRGVSIEGGRWSATTHERSSTEAVENDQRTSPDDENVPEAPPTPPEPPDKPVLRHSKSPSAELEGERNAASSCDVERTSGDTDMSGVSTNVEDAGNEPKEL